MQMQMDILLWLQSFRTDALNTIMILTTNLGSETLYILLIAFLYWCYHKKAAFKWMNVLMISAFSNAIIKVGLHAARPFQVNTELKPLYVESATSFSFPSGHTMNAATNLTWAARLVRKWWFTIIAIVIMVSIGFSRLYLGVHWPQDVLAGLCLGIVIAFGYEWYCNKMPDYVEVPTLLLAIAVSVAFRDASSIKLLGTFFGGIMGYWLGEYKQWIRVHSWNQGGVWKYTLGLIVILGMQIGLKWVIPESLNLYRYAIVGFTLTFLWPWIFQSLYRKRAGDLS